MYLIDTNIFIYALNGKYPKLMDKLLSINPSQIKISAITVSELEYGASKSNWGNRTRFKMQCFLSCYEVLPFMERDAVTFGRIRATLVKQGKTPGLLDAMIGAQGVSRGLIVVTHNTKDYCHIPDIQLEDWVE